jgi:hypothetical protein
MHEYLAKCFYYFNKRDSEPFLFFSLKKKHISVESVCQVKKNQKKKMSHSPSSFPSISNLPWLAGVWLMLMGN